MSKIIKIQWCDSTVNPVMGCGGCKLLPSSSKARNAVFAHLEIEKIMSVEGRHRELVSQIHGKTWDLMIDQYHRRHNVADAVNTLVCKSNGRKRRDSAELARVIADQFRCYAGIIDWVIMGGESEGGAMPFNLEWAQSLRDLCRKEEVPFFAKQLGARPLDDEQSMSLSDAHGGDWNEWAEDLRVRELPVEGMPTVETSNAVGSLADVVQEVAKVL